MTYTEDFYEVYEEYIRLPSVRQAHDWALNVAVSSNSSAFEVVFDLGCGRSREFFHFAPLPSPCSRQYLGIDINADKSLENNIIDDYRECDLKVLAEQKFEPRGIVSLFSVEVSGPAEQNYCFYERLFTELPTIEVILTSGVYHPNKKDQSTVQVGPITSYQTLEQPEDFQSEIFVERRLVFPVSSELFGEEYEVWKILNRKG